MIKIIKKKNPDLFRSNNNDDYYLEDERTSHDTGYLLGLINGLIKEDNILSYNDRHILTHIPSNYHKGYYKGLLDSEKQLPLISKSKLKTYIEELEQELKLVFYQDNKYKSKIKNPQSDKLLIDKRYRKFKSLVNMSAKEMKEWKKQPCSKAASIKRLEVINRVTRLLEKNKKFWNHKDYVDSGKVISYLSRAIAIKDSSIPASKLCRKGKNYYALKNWAYDRNK